MKFAYAHLSFSKNSKKTLFLILKSLKGYTLRITMDSQQFNVYIQRVSSRRIAVRNVSDNSEFSFNPYSNKIKEIEVLSDSGTVCNKCGSDLFLNIIHKCPKCFGRSFGNKQSIKPITKDRYQRKFSKANEIIQMAKEIKATTKTDLAKALGVTRQAIDCAVETNNIDKGYLQEILDSNKRDWSLFPHKGGIVLITDKDKKIYGFSNSDIKTFSRIVSKKFGQDARFFLVKLTSNADIECLKYRLSDPDSRLISETDTKFPYIVHHKPTNSWTVRFRGKNSVYFPKKENAINALKELIIFNKELPNRANKHLTMGLTKENLEKLYIKEGKTLSQIATLLKVSFTTIQYHLSKHEIRKKV